MPRKTNKVKVDEKYLNALKLVLNQVDLIVNAYEKEEVTETDQILLHVFGLLQTLFVGVDALYDLVEEVTNNKFLININQNDKMHELKFIRNDVVGHPTSRTYRQRRQGFCMLDLKDISFDKIKYDTYIKKKNGSVKVDTREVNLLHVISEFKKEKNDIVEGVKEFMEKPYEKDLWLLVSKLEKMYLDRKDVSNQIKEIKHHLASETYQQKTENRLVWRLNLLELASNWKTNDAELNNFIKYIRGEQLNKVIEIALIMTGQTRSIKKQKLPYLLKDLYFEIKDNEEEMLPLITNLHDKRHPLHFIDLDELISLCESRGSLKLLNFLKEEQLEEKVYLIGSMIKNYKKRKK